jgi:hypothetical protein
MSAYTLRSSTGSAIVDGVLMAIVGRYEFAFPGLIRAYFVIGSYADASMVPISDLDLMIMFATPLTSSQLALAHALIQQCADGSPVRLDMGLTLVEHYPARRIGRRMSGRSSFRARLAGATRLSGTVITQPQRDGARSASWRRSRVDP